MDLVHKLVGGAGKSKLTPIYPFLFHLHDSQGLLTDEEETDNRAAQELANYRITPEPKPKSILVSDDEVEDIIAPELLVQQLKELRPSQQPNQSKRMKHTYRAPEG